MREPLGVFLKSLDKTPLLIVRLDAFSNDLLNGLATADAEAKRTRFSRALKSTLQLSPGVTEQIRFVRATEVVPPGESAADEDTSQRKGFPAPELLETRCYVVRLSNRTDRPGPLSIGRDTSHDIVLQHSSVSATHAHMTVGSELSLRDAGSRNGTFVNSVQIKGSVPVRAGDRIKLGAVTSVLCSASELWHVVPR